MGAQMDFQRREYFANGVGERNHGREGIRSSIDPRRKLPQRIHGISALNHARDEALARDPTAPRHASTVDSLHERPPLLVVREKDRRSTKAQAKKGAEENIRLQHAARALWRSFRVSLHDH